MDARRAHSRDLRKGRLSESGRIYLLTTTTHRRQSWFADWRCGRLVVKVLRGQRAGQTLAFVVMPDHLHWLVQLGAQESLARLMRRVKSVSAHQVNRYLGRTGPVWQDGYHDHALRAEEDVRAAARYIIANPLRAGLVESVGEWPLWDAMWV